MRMQGLFTLFDQGFPVFMRMLLGCWNNAGIK